VTNADVLRIAMEQSAIDVGCRPENFTAGKPKVVLSEKNEKARKYLSLPFFCNLISYGSNVVASVHESVAEVVENYIRKYPTEHCFETPNLHVLNDALKREGYAVFYGGILSARCFEGERDILRLRTAGTYTSRF